MINKKRLISTFIDLVKIDSPSGDEEEVASFVAEKLKSLGGRVIRDNYGNVIVKFEGNGTPFMLNSHLDTVEPGKLISPIVDHDIITSDGTTVLGGDPKAGVAIILETLQSIVEKGKDHLPIDAVFTLNEEMGLLGAINLDYSQIDAKIGVTLDATGGPSNIVISAPGYTEIDVKITGRSAHAGFEPEKGISAIKIAAEIISELELGRIDVETTANIGLIDGGSARNAVPESVHFKAEIRSRNLEKLEKHTLHFQKIFSKVLHKNKDIKIDTGIKTIFNPYAIDQSQNIIEIVQKSINKIGLKPNLKSSGGGADVNIFHSRELEIICLGAGYYNPHTTREYVKIPDMINGVKICTDLISKI